MQKARALHYERGKARLASEQDVVAQLNAKWVEGQQKLAAVQQELAVARREIIQVKEVAQREIMQLKEEVKALKAAAADKPSTLEAAAGEKVVA
eukprot:CAMPEP_0119314538 /NCGR_PEP_ID=MMETSP1333-20130426/33070_1 /TAXON_ID=418940 /ORGANISM="Scyphosphaera apsteinii, Strain RCC1455" /LENGTH=93 /DNA_ID=CAMNT_0007319663 /DNA_START=1 /DNA_END=282 /DNA_ORIENTATION=-